MRKSCVTLLTALFILFVVPGIANESEGDLNTFTPSMSTSIYNSYMKTLLNLNDTQEALIKVTSHGLHDGKLVYTNVIQDPVFIFDGTTNEYGTASQAYIQCSLKDDSALKNIPMIIWATVIQMGYYGEIEQTGESFLEWVNDGRRDGEMFTSPYFIASYKEEPGDNCCLLLIKL